jgi:nicotinate-nucleotide--dimethylbenzimidazole phosphoribosyltransferase
LLQFRYTIVRSIKKSSVQKGRAVITRRAPTLGRVFMAAEDATFEDMREILKSAPGPNTESGAKAAARDATLTKPAGSLGRMEALANWYMTWRDPDTVGLERPRVAVFVANHGVVARNVSAYPQAVTAQMVANFQVGGGAINQICTIADAELRVYEMGLDYPTADFTAGPAMSEGDCARAMAYGMMAVEDGVDTLCLGEMGIGNTTSAAALSCALFGGAPGDWVGPGAGVDAAGVAHKAAIVAEALALHGAEWSDPLEALRRVGGMELAAIAGAVLAARMARVPVILDGFACCAAAAVLQKMDPGALDHCVVGHVSKEPGHARLLDAMGMAPILDLGLGLGEGSGAATALLILRAAVACHTGMATFAEAGVATAATTATTE